MRAARQRLNESLRALDRVAVEAAKKFAPTLCDSGLVSSGSEKALQQLQPQQQANGNANTNALSLQSFQSLHSLCGAAAPLGGGSSGGAMAGGGAPNLMSMSLSLSSSGVASGASLTPVEQSLLSLQSLPAPPPDLIPPSAAATRQNSVDQFQQQAASLASLAPLKHGELAKIVGDIHDAGLPLFVQ